MCALIWILELEYRGCSIFVMGIDSINCHTTNSGVKTFSNNRLFFGFGKKNTGAVPFLFWVWYQ